MIHYYLESSRNLYYIGHPGKILVTYNDARGLWEVKVRDNRDIYDIMYENGYLVCNEDYTVIRSTLVW